MTGRDTASTGLAAEAAACRFLEAHGLATVTRNYRCRLGEIDLVMRDGRELVLVEVRYRRNATQVHPYVTVTAQKQRRILRAAQHLLLRNPKLAGAGLRFDVVAVTGDLAAPRFEWLRAGFDATGIASDRRQRL